MKRLLRCFQTVWVLLLLSPLIFMSAQLNAQESFPLDWHTFYGGHPTELNHTDEGRSIVEYDGSLYIAGLASGPGNFDGATINRQWLGGRDGIVMKTTVEGDLEWVTFLGGWYNEDECNDIAVVGEGLFQGIYVCGLSAVWRDDGAINPWIEPINAHYSGGGQDAFIVKLTLEGEIVWLTYLGGQQLDIAREIEVDADLGYIYVTGDSGGPWILSSYTNNEINAHSTAGQQDAFAAKLDTDGNYFWHTFLGGTNGNGQWDRGSGIGYDGAGNVYVGGSSRGTWGTPLTGFEHHSTGSDIYGEDGFIAKLLPNGVRDWHIFIGTPDLPSYADQCHDIVVDEDGNIYATGYTWGDWGSEWGTPRVAYGPVEAEDKYVTKINTEGVPQWHTILGGPGGDQGHDIILLDNGDLFFTGTESETWGNPVLPKPASNSSADVFAVKLDNDGYVLWNAIMGGFYTDRGLGITADAAGYIYTTGFSMFPWACVDPPLHPHAGESSNPFHTEIFIAKLNTEVSAISPEIVSFSVVQGETVSTVIHVFDPCVKLTSLIAGVGDLVDNMDGTWTWSLETSGTSIGFHEITISADDQAGWTPYVIINLEVTPANQPPVFTIDHNPVFVQKGETAINSGTVSDPEGDPLGVGSWPLQLTYDGAGNWTWNMSTVGLPIGLHPVTVFANDGDLETLGYFDVIVKDDEERIGDGLEWLAGQQDDGGGDDDGSWNGQFDCFVQNDAQVTISGFALSKFCSHSYEEGLNPLDQSYLYYDNIWQGFDYLFSRAQTAGPGSGIYFEDPHPFGLNYSTAAVMMAIGSSRLPSYTINYPENPVVHELTFLQLMQEMVNYLVGSQQPDGSWDGDNIVSGNVAFGLLYAEAFGIEVPSSLKDKLSLWIDETQDDISQGGMQFPGGEPNMFHTAHIMVEMALVGDNVADNRVQNAVNYLADHWCHPEWDNMWNDQYVELFYTIMKAFKLFEIETIITCEGEIDWFTDLVNRTYRIHQHPEEGYWWCAWGVSTDLATCLALLTMEGDIPIPSDDCYPPVISGIQLPPDPVSMDDQPVTVTVYYDDPDFVQGNAYSCEFNFGDGSDVETTTSSELYCTSPGHYYSLPGVYSLTAAVSDGCGDPVSLTSTEYIVIYDPSEGFVTGGGWIESPEGAYLPDPTLTGTANFGFVSKYKKGQSVPDGNTQFQFHAAGMNFHSTSYEWMVITHHKAMYKGEGEINGDGLYGFMLSAIDEDLTPSTDVDLFRIQIWDKNSGDAIVYDNQIGDDPNGDPTTAIEGGNIKIHSGNKSAPADGFGDDMHTEVPEKCILFQNYPNPTKYATTIRFGIPYDTQVLLKIYDMTGNLVTVLTHRNYTAGYHSIEFNTSHLAVGVYYIWLETDEDSAYGKMIKKK